MRKLEDPRQRLVKAIARDKGSSVKLKALDDPDLDQLWREIGKA